tara:strand:- start:5481 stop:5897 length:417 start_codon:yes stop_codon:yes gene_type:complete
MEFLVSEVDDDLLDFPLIFDLEDDGFCFVDGLDQGRFIPLNGRAIVIEDILSFCFDAEVITVFQDDLQCFFAAADMLYVQLSRDRFLFDIWGDKHFLPALDPGEPHFDMCEFIRVVQLNAQGEPLADSASRRRRRSLK